MKVSGLRYRDEWLPNFFPAREVRAGSWLRLSRTGATVTMFCSGECSARRGQYGPGTLRAS